MLKRCVVLARGVASKYATSGIQPQMSRATTSLLPSCSVFNQMRFYASQTETQLCDFLKQEIEDEKKLVREQLGDSPTPSIPGFKIETQDALVTLSKTHANEKISVVFNVNNSVDTEDYHQESPPEDSSSMVARPPFTIEVEKGGHKLAFECRIVEPTDAEPEQEENDLFAIEEMYVYSGGEVTEKVFVTSGAILDGTLYDRLMDYMDERGVNSEFVESLQKFATHYEHAQYTLILQKVHDFVKA